jgi:hypothetical protein
MANGGLEEVDAADEKRPLSAAPDEDDAPEEAMDAGRKRGAGDEGADPADGKRRKTKEDKSLRPFQLCNVVGCDFKSKWLKVFKQHQATVHGIGDVAAAEERRRREKEYIARQPVQHCGVGRCAYQTKYRKDLRKHQECVHGIVETEARGAGREEQPTTRCDVEGCDYETKYKSNLRTHQARIHDIDPVWFHCQVEGCAYNAKSKGEVTKHTRRMHS